MKLNIAICDDEKIEREYVKALVNEWSDKTGFSIQINEFKNAETFLFHYEDKSDYDILLLDIQMSQMDGVALAKKVREHNKTVQIVFITGFPDFIAEGYEVSALHYLIKPVCTEKLCSVLDKAVSNLNKKEKSIILEEDGSVHIILLRNIFYVESQDHYVFIHTQEKSYKIKKNLTDLIKQLDDSFYRCQRSYVINLEHILKVTKTHVYLKNERQIPIARGSYHSLNEAILKYFL